MPSYKRTPGQESPLTRPHTSTHLQTRLVSVTRVPRLRRPLDLLQRPWRLLLMLGSPKLERVAALAAGPWSAHRGRHHQVPSALTLLPSTLADLTTVLEAAHPVSPWDLARLLRQASQPHFFPSICNRVCLLRVWFISMDFRMVHM